MKPLSSATNLFRECFTSVKCVQGLQHAPPEGGQGVLDAGAQAQGALEVRLLQQLLPVGDEVRRAAQQGRHVVHELRHQAGVGVVGLAVVVRHHLGATKSGEKDAARVNPRGNPKRRTLPVHTWRSRH